MYAMHVIVETETQQIRVALREPMTMEELWDHFVIGGCNPISIVMAKGIARVVLQDRRAA